MTRKVALCLKWLGWSLAVASMFLPVTTALATRAAGHLLGWEALIATTGSIFNFWFWLYALAEPAALWLPALGIATTLLLAMPPATVLADDRAGCLQIPLAAVPIAFWRLPLHIQSSLLLGVWIWAAAFVLVGLGGCVRCFAAARFAERT